MMILLDVDRQMIQFPNLRHLSKLNWYVDQLRPDISLEIRSETFYNFYTVSQVLYKYTNMGKLFNQRPSALLQNYRIFFFAVFIWNVPNLFQGVFSYIFFRTIAIGAMNRNIGRISHLNVENIGHKCSTFKKSFCTWWPARSRSSFGRTGRMCPPPPCPRWTRAS